MGRNYYCEGGEYLAQSSYGSTPGSVQGRVRWSSEECGLGKGVPPAIGGGVGTRLSLRFLPTQTILCFYGNELGLK